MLFNKYFPSPTKINLIPDLFSFILFIIFINQNSTNPDFFNKIVTN
jgi:hypothetical protein